MDSHYNLKTVPAGKWSGKCAVPAVGDRVRIRLNRLGSGVVVSYFTEDGWVGVRVLLDVVPDWLARQNPGDRTALAFGAEIEPEARG